MRKFAVIEINAHNQMNALGKINAYIYHLRRKNKEKLLYRTLAICLGTD